MNEETKPRMVGVNHIALEVGDIEEALAFYARIFTFKLRGRGQRAAFIDMGDQFIALTEGRSQSADDDRHFGLVVDDRSHVRKLAEGAGTTILEVLPLTSSTRGATAFRWLNTAIYNLQRRPPY